MLKNLSIKISKRAVLSLVVANLALLIPFAVGFGAMSYFEPKYLSGDVPDQYSLKQMAHGFLFGLVFNSLATVFIALPALYFLNKKQKVQFSDYWRESCKWLWVGCSLASIGFAIFIVPHASGVAEHFLYFIGSACLLFAIFLVPVSLCSLTYWCIYYYRNVSWFRVLIVTILLALWVFETLQIVAAMAA